MWEAREVRYLGRWSCCPAMRSLSFWRGRCARPFTARLRRHSESLRLHGVQPFSYFAAGLATTSYFYLINLFILVTYIKDDLPARHPRRLLARARARPLGESPVPRRGAHRILRQPRPGAARRTGHAHHVQLLPPPRGGPVVRETPAGLVCHSLLLIELSHTSYSYSRCCGLVRLVVGY